MPRAFLKWNETLASVLEDGLLIDLCEARFAFWIPLVERMRLRAFPFSSDDQRQEFTVDVGKILSDLRQKRDELEQAIVSLERLARTRGDRRGRPPAWVAEIKRRGRPPGSKNKPRPEVGATHAASVVVTAKETTASAAAA
jgi:hypothetical protein